MEKASTWCSTPWPAATSPLCLEALRPGGWHCEIGKVDIYADNALSLAVFRKNLRFAAIDVDRLMNDDPYLTRELSQECLNLLENGAVPPLPITTFPYRDYEEPLRLMTAGRHTGKLVLQAPPAGGGEQPPVADLRPYLDPEATYLVTGAFGGFGRLLLPYLATAGARHITLLDRDPRRGRSADWLRKTSALWYLPDDIEIDIVAGDVASDADVRNCIAALRRPLKGVFHLAGTLDDCLLADLTPSRWPPCSRPRRSAPSTCTARPPAATSTTSCCSRRSPPRSAIRARSITAPPTASSTAWPPCAAGRACRR